MSFAQSRSTPFQQTANASGNATATQTGVANQTIYITDIAASSDLSTSTLVIKDGSTVIWQIVLGVANTNFSWNTPLKITLGATCTAVVTATSAGNVNISGFIVNNS